MDFGLAFTDKEITPWGGMALMKRMLDHLIGRACAMATLRATALARNKARRSKSLPWIIIWSDISPSMLFLQPARFESKIGDFL
jgi:hypothetical protein